MTLTLEQAREALPQGYEVSDKELEDVLAFFYFIGEKAYEQARKEARDE
ncbi:MAG: hypothetical protein UW94_C0006G0027 [Parcubacteria group bacterium GW2011_GWA2_45_14]|nr:MAG: hypothetical protein UW94_C0006G0027 [Parcubacteria group bacterium GW2011_GWA2_45_14]